MSENKKSSSFHVELPLKSGAVVKCTVRNPKSKLIREFYKSRRVTESLTQDYRELRSYQQTLKEELTNIFKSDPEKRDGSRIEELNKQLAGIDTELEKNDAAVHESQFKTLFLIISVPNQKDEQDPEGAGAKVDYEMIDWEEAELPEVSGGMLYFLESVSGSSYALKS